MNKNRTMGIHCILEIARECMMFNVITEIKVWNIQKNITIVFVGQYINLEKEFIN